MFKEDDEEYKKRIERAKVLRNSVGMITDNDNINIKYDKGFQDRLNKAKELRNSVGMITSNDLEEPEEQDLDTNIDLPDITQDNNEPQIDYEATVKDYLNNYLNNVSSAIDNVGKAPEMAYKAYEEQKLQEQQKEENEKKVYESLTDEQKKEIDKKIQESKSQNIPLPSETTSYEELKAKLEKEQQEATSIENTSFKMATPEQIKNMQKFSNIQYKAWEEAEKRNENIAKGGIDAFNEYVATIGDNILGGLAKKPIAGLANVATTITGLGLKGLSGVSKIFGLNDVGNNLDNAYSNVVDFGSDINERANFESLVTSQIKDDFTRASGKITDVISNMVGNQLVGYAVGIPGTVAQGLSVGGSSAQEVLDENKDNIGQATITGLAKGYTSYLTEKMFDANILTRGQSSSISRLVDNAISRNIQSKLGKEFANRFVGIVGENLEELVEDNVDNLIDKIVNDKDLPDFKQWWENTTETAKVTTLSTIIMSFLGLGGETFENKEKDIQADKWINEAKKIIKQEDMTIHYNPEQVKSKNSMEQFYVSQFNQNGELEKVTPSLGKEIKNTNPQLMITPVIVKDSNSNLYEVIDGATGVILDNSYYDSVTEAENSYNDKVKNLSQARIDDINNTINEASYSIQNNVMNLVTQLEQQLPEIVEQYYQNNNSNSTDFNQNKNTDTLNNETPNYTTENIKTEYEQNSRNKTPEKSKFYEDKPNYAVSNINEIETELNKKNSYSLEQIGEIWSDIQENTYDLTLDDNMYVELEEDNGKLEAILYDGSTEEMPEVNRVAVEKTRNGRYTAEAINNAIKEAATIQDENRPIKGQVDIEGNEVRSMKKNRRVDINKKDVIIKGQDIKSNYEKNKVLKELRDWKSNYPDGVDTHTISSYGNHTYLYSKEGNNFTILARAKNFSTLNSGTKIDNILKEIGYYGRNDTKSNRLNSDIERSRDRLSKNSGNNAILTRRQKGRVDVKENNTNVRQQGNNKSISNNERIRKNNKSIVDNQNRPLTKQQQEYFKNSRVRDEKGNLITVYHGTNNAGFTEFKRNINYYTDNIDIANTYTGNNGIYKGYINIENPIVVDANKEVWSKIDIENIKIDGVENIKEFLDSYGASTWKENGKIRTSTADIVSAISDAIEDGKFEADGIIINNVYDEGAYSDSTGKYLGNDYITFKSNQFKNTTNDSPTSNSDIRYMKKSTGKTNNNKEFKQNLAKQFEKMTGDTILLAGAKLGGIELRNKQRDIGTLQGEKETNPYSKEAMKIYRDYHNSQKTSSYLYHATSRGRLESIMKNGLTTGNEQNQKGVSATDRIYLSANPELAESYAAADSVLLRINPRFYDSFENFEQDLLGGTGSYSITNNIPANMLQIKENGKWVSLNNISNKENIRLAKNNKEDNAIRNAERGESYIEQEIQKIEQTGDWDNSIPITKLTDIRKTIEDYLGLGIKKGHFRQDAYALYKGNNDVIRTKEYKDMDSILHETGHAMDLGNRLKIDKESIADELLTAIDKLGGYEEETRTVRLEEGFAEVIREYSIIPNQAKIDYPQTVAVLEGLRKSDKKFNDFITKVQQQTYNYIHQNPRNRALNNMSVGEQTDRTPLSKNRIKQLVMQNIYDKDWVVKSAVNELAKANGKTVNQIKASKNAYYLTRLASGKTDKVISMLSDGYIDEYGNKLFPGLNGIGEILGENPERYNDLRAYLVAQRDLEYKAKTLKTGIRTMDSKAVVEQFKNDKQIQQASKLVYDTLNGVMQYAVNNGLITQEGANKLKESNAFYVPMHRVLDNRGNQVGRRGAVADLIQKRTGSELDVKDVLENIIANSSNMIQQVENNNILRALYKEGQTTGLTGAIYDVIDTPLTKIGTAQLSTWENELKKQGVNTADLDLEKTIDLFAPNNKVDSKNLITSFINENGKRIYLQFNDELLFNSLMNMDKKFMSKWLKFNSKANMPLRYGATMANLGFAIPNMISDTAQATIFSTAGFVPVVDNVLGVLDILAAKNKNVRNFVNQVAPEYAKRINNLYSLYQQSGATSSTRMSQYRESTQNLMADVYGTKSKTLGIKEKYKPLKRLLDILTYLPEISEQSTRLRVFEKNYEYYKKKGTAETDARILAALESRDATQDFGRTGNITREINQLIPFSAARVGSAYTFAEKIKANPKQVGMRIALLTTLAMAIKAMGYDDDEIEELNQRKKDDNFVLRAGDKIVTIKKPQGILRSFINLAEYIQDLATGHIEEGKEGEKLGEWLHNTLTDNLPADNPGGYVPNIAKPIIEFWSNHDLYYNTDIVKSYDLDLPDSEQYYDYNSQIAIWLGKVFDQSPAKIDKLISGYFGGLGTSVTGAIDYTLGKSGVIPEKPEMGAEQNTIGKRFVVNVNTNSASIDEVYNKKTELTKKQNGGTITTEEQEELKTIKSAISNMSDLNKQIKEIKKDLTMSGEEKAEKIRVLQQEKTDTARKALGKDLIHTENEAKIQSTQFYPNDTLKKNGYSLTLDSSQKKEYEQLANDFYTKYEKQGLYNQEKLEDIKSKAKDYAKNQMFKKYRTNLVKTK